MILPAAAARNISRTARQHALFSVLIGLAAVFAAHADTVFQRYQNAMRIVPGSGEVTSTLANFPVLVRLYATPS